MRRGRGRPVPDLSGARFDRQKKHRGSVPPVLFLALALAQGFEIFFSTWVERRSESLEKLWNTRKEEKDDLLTVL